MKSTNPIRLIAALSCVVLLASCGGAPFKKERKEVVSESVETEQAALDSEPPLVKIPRPEQTVKVDIPKSARDEFSLAKQTMIRGNWQEAEGQLLLMTETYPQLAGVYTNLGIVYTELEAFDKAEKAYRFAIESNNLNFDAYTNLGFLLRELGKFEEAEANYKAALGLWPHHKPSVLNLGILYDMYMGKLPEALDLYKLAQRLNDEEDRKLKGWIVDLERRMPKSETEVQN